MFFMSLELKKIMAMLALLERTELSHIEYLIYTFQSDQGCEIEKSLQ